MLRITISTFYGDGSKRFSCLVHPGDSRTEGDAAAKKKYVCSPTLSKRLAIQIEGKHRWRDIYEDQFYHSISSSCNIEALLTEPKGSKSMEHVAD